jgi:hypothetical protein
LADLKANVVWKLAKTLSGIAHPSNGLSPHPFRHISVLI